MSDRRSYLRGLATLPLIGGSVAILGQPTRVVQAATPAEITDYVCFCISEMNDGMKYLQSIGLFDDPAFKPQNRIDRWYARAQSQPHVTLRAPIVLNAIGYPLTP